ncbi:uncharacterized protein [Periplaneta americana]|uniref:uncharacterized protein n=1 Tax=Periplaneta americana TaxID=6978 RepID=UPI0037E854F2
MAAVPGKRKPPTPPKPPLGRLGAQHLTETHSDVTKERCINNVHEKQETKNEHVCDEIDAAHKGTNERKTLTLKIKTDESLDVTGFRKSGISATELKEGTQVAVIKCSGDKLSPKPPLLPKPQTSPKVLAYSTKPCPPTKPLVPKRPNLVSAIEGNGKEVSTPSPSKSAGTSICDRGVSSQEIGGIAKKKLPLNIKAPVAKLEEFDTFCESVKSETPLRPPRSPKNQPFKGEPFKVFEVKPELPVKKRNSNCTSDDAPVLWVNSEALQSNWETVREKSASLGRTNAFRYVDAKAKSASLGRNKVADFSRGLSNLQITNTPIPPPRLRKKQCGHSNIIPVYAQVNYSLKKNRRQTAENVIECAECIGCTNEEVAEEQIAVIEGKLVLPAASHACPVTTEEVVVLQESKLEDRDTASQDAIVPKENDETLIVKEENVYIAERIVTREECDNENSTASDTKNTEHLINGCVNSQDKVSNITVTNFIVVDNSDQVYPADTKTSVPSGETTCSEIIDIHTWEKCSDSCLEWSPDDSTSEKIEWQFAELSLHDSTGDASEHPTFTENSSELYRIIQLKSNTFQENETSVAANSEDKDSTVEVSSTSDLVIVNESTVNCETEADVHESTENVFQECRLSTSSLPTRRKLDMKEPGKLHRRRQSWSNCKDGSPSPEKSSHRFPSTSKRKSRSRSWWCDEGEPSSGALGDLDSSDNTARQSSFEEVDRTGSDVDDGQNPVRSKLSCWFGSFGKGNRKHKTRRDSNSQFYYDSNEKIGEGTPELEHIPALEVTDTPGGEGQDVEAIDVFNSTVTDGSRPPSGLSALSALSALDCDQKSDAPVSEESFEIYQHSESENEVETNVEDSSTSHFQSEEMRLEKKAFYIAQELMTSERVFIDVLKLLSMDFRQAVNASSSEHKYSVIPNADLCKILNSLPQLQSLNEDLLRDLEHRISNWNEIKKIADVIVKKGPFLKLYTSYIQNFESQCSYLDECCQKYPKFAKVVKEFEASPRCQKLSLKHYMLKPVQRIPQYRLLLEDYLHHLSPSSPDLEDTRTALKIVCDVADHANRSIKEGDHLSKLLQLQSQLGNYEIIKPGRMFLKDGELFKLSRKGMQPRYFILLNDCLLYTSYYGSVQSSGLKVNYELPLSSMKVNIPQAEDYHNEFSIISVKRSFTLSAQSLEERQEWVDALQKAITDYTSRQLTFQNMKISSSMNNEESSEPFKLGQEAPVWIQDRRVTMCQSCTAEFTVTFRRHHCRACGKVVCGDCSDFRAPLQYMRFQSARVCEECHDKLLEEAKDPTSKLNQAMKRELGSTTRITDTFKRLGPPTGKKVKKFIPQRLKEVTANDTGSQISGWLQRRSRRSWKRLWFVLKEQVLYVYKASEDVVALESIPVLGYSVEPMKERHFQLYEGIDAKLVFQLAHPGQHPLIFHADSEHLANRWIAAMNEATVLK